jgi:signal transduction histidine kinase
MIESPQHPGRAVTSLETLVPPRAAGYSGRVTAGLEFPDGPRSELERTIEELVERANAVLHTQGRLRSLLRANTAVVEELELGRVLRRIAEAAVELADAEYGALGVIAPDGTLEQFIHVGMPDAAAALIAHLPEGHGLLGAVIDRAEPIRLEHLADDRRSVGFPAHHPPMDGFLGVPIRVRNEVFGNLYLTNPRRGVFSEEDEELVSALAATAGIAIDNARLFDETRRRQRWSTALAEVTSALLSGESEDVLEVLAERLAVVIDAELVCVVVPGGDTGMLRVAAARGTGDADMVGREFPAAGTLAGAALESRSMVVSDGRQAGESAEWQPVLGPTIVLPLIAAGEVLGTLSISRAPGGPRFANAELEMASEFASQTGLAIELTRARADRQRLELVDERSRIARDLHDHVIQRLFGTGLALQALAARTPGIEPEVMVQVDAIDAAIAEIRTAVFTLTSARQGAAGGLRHRLLDLVGEMSPTLEMTPRLTFSGAVDLTIRDDVADDVVAVVRESLANVARHAAASTVAVEVSLDDDLVVVTVDDDGRGIEPKPGRRSGTANLESRALRRGGSLEISRRESGGTRVRWTARIEGEKGAHG